MKVLIPSNLRDNSRLKSKIVFESAWNGVNFWTEEPESSDFENLFLLTESFYRVLLGVKLKVIMSSKKFENLKFICRFVWM